MKDVVYFLTLSGGGSPSPGYLYYKAYGYTDGRIALSVMPIALAEEKDQKWVEWFIKHIKEYGYIVCIAADKQRAWMELLIEEHLKEYVHYRQPAPCFNNAHPGDYPRLSTYVFKEPKQ